VKSYNKFLGISALILLGAFPALGQNAPKLVPTENQSLRLQVKQKDAQLQQIAFQQASEAFQKAMDDLRKEGEKVKAENGWDAGTIFSIDTLSFTAPAPKPVAKPEVKPEAKK
jgi:hypothetical protein